MKQIKVFTLSCIYLLFSVFLVGCGERQCPAMSDMLIDFVPYSPNEKVLFINEESDTLVFITEFVNKNIEKYCTNKPNACSRQIDVKLNSELSYIYFCVQEWQYPNHPKRRLNIVIGESFFNWNFYDSYIMPNDTITLIANDESPANTDASYVKVLANKGIIEFCITENKFGIHKYKWTLLE
ncbi:MAG: hypothetical protein LBR45_04775 [Bacteroidales bacterium]|jgi:hypothetical protein|nr:hypothetical protein [Bacteroidales bacterium]